MITIDCPRCSVSIEVDEASTTRRGKLRVACESCGTRFAMRLRKAGATPMPEGASHSPESVDDVSTRDSAVEWPDEEEKVVRWSRDADDDEDGEDDEDEVGSRDAEDDEPASPSRPAPKQPRLPTKIPAPPPSTFEEAHSGEASVEEQMAAEPAAADRPSVEQPAPAPRGRISDEAAARDRRIVITNSATVHGFRVEPIGMVVDCFCRPGGGEGAEARKRVRAFGERYRKALRNLSRQAQHLEADTITSLDVVLTPSASTPDAVMWVLVQGTAARRYREG